MANLTQHLAAELQAAHGIINLALNILTGDQKQAWLDAVCQAGLDGEGITRANERKALIAIATAAPGPRADGAEADGYPASIEPGQRILELAKDVALLAAAIDVALARWEVAHG